MSTSVYDVLIVGAGIAGSALAHALADHPSKPRIALLERSLATPDRIVGELLQPTGVESLRRLGIESTLEGIEATRVDGYYIWDGVRGKSVQIPYPKPEGKYQGRSFHHGSFVDKLREAAKSHENVSLVEATVSELVYENESVVGVRAKVGPEKIITTYKASLTIVADGCFSIFRSKLLATPTATKSHFVGTIIKNAELPMKYHGTVGLVPNGHGPLLLYQIRDPAEEGEDTHTRLLVDVKAPLPRDLKGHIRTNIVPFLPPALHEPILNAIESTDPEFRIRTMPNTFLPPTPQSSQLPPGVFLLGDAYNMRHPLTGGGMSVALNDVVILRDLLYAQQDASLWRSDSTLETVLHEWYWKRKPLSSTINILSFALYDLFGADDRNLAILKNGCFKYFELGGECVDGPVSLLSGIKPSPTLLFLHFFAVAFYSIIVLFTRSNPALLYGSSSSMAERRARPWEWPSLIVRGFIVFFTAVQVFGPLLWSEVRWWNPYPMHAAATGTATTRGHLQHGQLYSKQTDMRLMTVFACLASAFVYYQVAVLPNSTMVSASQANVGFVHVLDTVKGNVGSLWGALVER